MQDQIVSRTTSFHAGAISTSLAFLSVFAAFVAPGTGLAAPAITGTTGSFANGQSVTIGGSGFGTKSSQNGAAPVAYSDMENDSVSARIGGWRSTTLTTVSTLHQRHSHSAYNASCDMHDLGGGQDVTCAFSGGQPAPQWYTQHWFYVDSNFSWGSGPLANGNNKIFRLEQSDPYINDLVIEGTNSPSAYAHTLLEIEHSDADRGGWGKGWSPVTSQYTCVDQAFGHACPDPVDDYWNIYPADIGWASFASDMAPSTWHVWQFEFQSSSGAGAADGVLHWWADGKLVLSKADLVTKTSENPTDMWPFIVGISAIHNSQSDGAIGNYYLDDVYIDSTWQRVEIGNAPAYDSCTLKEIQPATAWADGSIAVTINQGAFADGSGAYLFVTDATGARNTGYPVAFAASCVSGADCVTPPVCHSAAGASCSAGACSYPPAEVTVACSTGNPCTTGDHCDGAGTCVPGASICVDAGMDAGQPEPDAATPLDAEAPGLDAHVPGADAHMPGGDDAASPDAVNEPADAAALVADSGVAGPDASSFDAAGGLIDAAGASEPKVTSGCGCTTRGGGPIASIIAFALATAFARRRESSST